MSGSQQAPPEEAPRRERPHLLLTLRSLLGERPRLAAALFGAGALAIAIALGANTLGVAASRAFGWKKAVVLIVGCDLIVAGLVVSARRTRDAEVDLVALLSGAIADGVLAFAISADAVIVLFGQSKPIERLGYFLALLVVVPLTIALAWRRAQAGTAGERQRLTAFSTLVATAGVLCLARLLALSPTATLNTSLFVVIALVAARIAIAIAARWLPDAWSRRVPVSAIPLLFALAALPFVPPATLSTVDVAVGLAAGIAAFDLARAFGGRSELSRRWMRALDATILAGMALVVLFLGPPDIVVATNQNYFLGPALDVLHGHPMLVGTFSQYGVGLMDALAALFLVVPIGYGTSTLLVSVLTALLFAGLYYVVRWSSQSVLIAALALTVAVTLDIFGQLLNYVDFPSTGVLRFGMPWLVLVLSVAAARTARHKRLLRAFVLATVAVAAVWSAEAGAYTLAVAGALACLDGLVADASPRARLKIAARRVAELVAASVGGVLAFTLLTKVSTGAWADWGAYVYYVRLYTTGGFGNLPIQPWSPGLALGAMYAVSAIVIVVLALTRPELMRRYRVAFHAAAGLTVLGTVVYTYYLGRAHPNNLVHISPPGVALLFVWLGIARLTFNSRMAAAIATGTAVFVAAMIVASEADDISVKYPDTALAAVLGSAPSVGTALSALWNNGYVEPGAPHVIGFVAALNPRPAHLELLLTPYVETEALLHLDKANLVGSSNPCQESLSTQSPARIASAVRTLAPGTTVVTSSVIPDEGQLLPIEQYTLALLRARFTFRQIGSDGQGLQAFLMTTPIHATAHPPVAPSPPSVPGGCA